MGSDATLTGGNTHHSLAAHEVVLLLGTDATEGLSATEATDRLGRFGPNVLPPTHGAGVLRRLVRQVQHPLVYVLLGAGATAAALGQPVDAGVIFGVVVVNALIGFIQESKAEAALGALRAMVQTEARVVRGGRTLVVGSDDLVPGDLVLVQAGDKVPADLRLVRRAELRVDESALTGESEPVVKDEVVLPGATPVADRRNMLYSGTLATGGAGAAIVVATGAGTELGEIHRLVGTTDVLATPLTRKLAGFSRILTVVILGLAVVTFGVGVTRGEPAAGMLTAAVALAVGAIPEGLPAAVTITLAIGVARMARRGAVIRRLPAVETLGSTTVICSDKTGTLTENQMTVREVWTPGRGYRVTGSGYGPDGQLLDADGCPAVVAEDAALRWCLLAGARCNEAGVVRREGRWQVVGDPTEGALIVAATKAGLDPDGLRDAYPRLATIPFTSDRQYMASLHDDRSGAGSVLLAKGAAERMLAMCGSQMGADGATQPVDRRAVLAAGEQLAGRGLRVLATAMRELPPGAGLDEEELEGTLVLTGWLALLDPPRASAAEAVSPATAPGSR